MVTMACDVVCSKTKWSLAENVSHIGLFGDSNTFMVSNVCVFANGNCVCF